MYTDNFGDFFRGGDVRGTFSYDYLMFRFMDQYGEMEEGALDADDIEGTLDEAGERMQQLIRDAQYSISLL
jgi:hypothetical protein